MAHNEEKPYTFYDLALKASDYKMAMEKLREASKMAEGARKILKSHEKTVEDLEYEVSKSKAEMTRILNNLEK